MSNGNNNSLRRSLTNACLLGPSTVMWKAAPSPGAYSAGRSKETVHAPEPVRWACPSPAASRLGTNASAFCGCPHVEVCTISSCRTFLPCSSMARSNCGQAGVAFICSSSCSMARARAGLRHPKSVLVLLFCLSRSGRLNNTCMYVCMYVCA